MNCSLTRAALAMALGAALLVPGAAFAQGFRGGPGGGGLSATRLPAGLQTRLKLTADQKARLMAIGEKMRGEMQALFQGGGGGDRQALQQQMRTLNEKSDAEAMALFTPDQKKQYTEMKTEAESYSGLGRASVALLSVEGLTGDQKTKLKALSQDGAVKRREALQSAQGGDFGAIREKMQAMEAESMATIKKILNPAQGKQLDTAIQELPAPGRRRRQNNN